MSTVQVPLLTEENSWFRSPSRSCSFSLSRASFDFSCFEEDGLFECDSFESLFSSGTNTPAPAVHTPPSGFSAPSLHAPQEEFKYTPHQFPEMRMWPHASMQQQQYQQQQSPSQDARLIIQHHSSEFQRSRRPVIRQNLLSSTPPKPMVDPGLQEYLTSSMDSSYEITNEPPETKPVKLENFGNDQQYQSMRPYQTFKSEDMSPGDCPSPGSEGEVKSPQKNSQYTFMDITPYMTLPQAEAARQLGIPVSTLSKRWRVATGRRKWPWRVVSKLDKEITTLLYNINIGTGKDKDKDLEERLSYLLAKREKALRAVRIRISNKSSC